MWSFIVKINSLNSDSTDASLNLGKNSFYQKFFYDLIRLNFNIFINDLSHKWSRGVMVNTLDSESNDPSSSLGGTCLNNNTQLWLLLFELFIEESKVPFKCIEIMCLENLFLKKTVFYLKPPFDFIQHNLKL